MPDESVSFMTQLRRSFALDAEYRAALFAALELLDTALVRFESLRNERAQYDTGTLFRMLEALNPAERALLTGRADLFSAEDRKFCETAASEMAELERRWTRLQTAVSGTCFAAHKAVCNG